MTSTDEFVAQWVVDRGLVDATTVDSARSQVARNNADLAKAPTKLIDVLVGQGHFSAAEFTRLLADEFGMETVDLDQVVPDVGALESLPFDLADRYTVAPVARRGRVLRVAISDPLDADTLDSLGHVLRLTVEPVLAPAADIRRAIERIYGAADRPVEAAISDLEADAAPADAPIADSAIDATVKESDAPIIRLVQMVISEAFKRRASDIHLEPMEKRFRVRYRIDGVLHEVENPPKRLQLSIVSRLKIMANISIAEKRIPQDGRIQATVSGRTIDLRVSSLPTVHGESIVMRILDKSGLRLGLPELGFLTDDQQIFERLITLPDGILLVTGPTGSGKTTTLYSCLHFINKPDRKIITVEDPVEYQLAGINQVPVRADIGMSFANALRSMLRQAPNIIMVGEIRDLETAEIAINAALTGHMVFSTLHTNDAPSAVTRLIDIGVKPFLISASLRAAMAQRLVRKICPNCRKPYTPDPQELRALNITRAQALTATFMRGAGCSECTRTGFRGRMGIFEIFVVNEEIQRMIYDNVTSSHLRQKARLAGMRTMREDGVRKVISGLTTIDEVAVTTVGDTD